MLHGKEVRTCRQKMIYQKGDDDAQAETPDRRLLACKWSRPVRPQVSLGVSVAVPLAPNSARCAPKTGRLGQALAKKRQMGAGEEQKFGKPQSPQACQTIQKGMAGHQKHKGFSPRNAHSLGCGLRLHLPLPFPLFQEDPDPSNLDQIVIVSTHSKSPSPLPALSLLAVLSSGCKSGPGLTQR